MIYPVVKQMAETKDPARCRVNVSVAARVSGFSNQAYYKWRAKPVCNRNRSDTALLEAVRRVWLTDITEHNTNQDKLCLCAVKGVFSNQIVS